MYTLTEGAANAVKICMGVSDFDRVLIVTDRHTNQVTDAIHDIARSITKSRVLVLEDYTSRPMKALPTEIIRSIPETTATFWITQLYEGELKSRTSFIDEALKYARHAHMPGVTKEIMEQGMCADYNSVYKATIKVYEIVKGAGSMHVASPDGTSLNLTFNTNWRWIPSHGIIREKGRWGNLPDGEVFTTPYSVNGTIVVSELGDWFAKKYGYLHDKIRFEIKNSRIDLDNIQCNNMELKREVLKYIKTDENSNRASEFAIPTNLALMARPLIGNMLQDEKARVHIAFGEPYGSQTNANWRSNTHVDCILEGCDITADGIEIMDSGRLLVD